MIFDNLQNCRKDLFGGKQLDFHGSDKAECQDLHFPKFFYNFNEYGFRCDSFNQESELPIMFLGCSFTEGIGVSIESSWGYQLKGLIEKEKKVKIPFWSLAWAGGSIDIEALLLLAFIDKLKPKYIFFLSPPITRRFFKFNGKPIMYNAFLSKLVSPVPLTSLDTNTIEKAKNLLIDEDYFNLESFKSLMLINEVCNRYQTKVFYSFWNIPNKSTLLTNIEHLNNFYKLKTIFNTIDQGRDQQHLGIYSHETFAHLIYEEIKGTL